MSFAKDKNIYTIILIVYINLQYQNIYRNITRHSSCFKGLAKPVNIVAETLQVKSSHFYLTRIL